MGGPSDDLPPPSYSEATTSTSTSTASPSRPFATSPLSPSTTTTTTLTPQQTGLPLPSPLTNHLRTLPSRLRATQLAQRTAQAADEFELTSRVVPLVEAFLADLTARARVPPLAELTLVPGPAVPPQASMSGAAERGREGEVVKVGRVDVGGLGGLGGVGDGKGDEKGGGKGDGRGVIGGGDSKGGRAEGSSLREVIDTTFGEWGRFDTFDDTEKENQWWFTDEEMARRLATYLRPEPNLQRRHVQATVVERKVVEKEKSGWGRFGLGGGRKKAVEQTSPALPSPASPALSSPGLADDDDDVKMAVRAEEVTFRWENALGVWESMTGWGVVVTVRVKP
ncbi:uncharacterized protein B0H64DRAFT_439890 [Chaetomium fimeti]|uniref:Uncharacterized protein n=1 Tax=Chaetomium fimeti TaxID=1854472 RepID=A0AAE0LWS0_9PEZI|nr:hypothetical protein B0H64DRAFT_439890 [Chaetomium fimeti]